jgi:ribosomal protein S19
LFKDEKNYKNIIITTRHIGHKYGEYAITKQPAIYKKNTKGKK